MSVVINVVVPSSRLEGIIASKIHRALRCQEILSRSIFRTLGWGRTNSAQAAVSATSPAYPIDQSCACCRSPTLGSTSVGYAISAARLPRLLAA